MSDTEKANVEQTKAQTEYTKAQTAQIYMDSNVLDPSEVRKSLASEGGFEIEEVISDNDLDLPDDVLICPRQLMLRISRYSLPVI